MFGLQRFTNIIRVDPQALGGLQEFQRFAGVVGVRSNLVNECTIEHESPQLLFRELDDLGVTAMHLLAHIRLPRPVPEFGQADSGVVSGHLPQGLRHQAQIGGRDRCRSLGAHGTENALTKHRFRFCGLLSYPLGVVAARGPLRAQSLCLECIAVLTQFDHFDDATGFGIRNQRLGFEFLPEQLSVGAAFLVLVALLVERHVASCRLELTPCGAIRFASLPVNTVRPSALACA